ncbi:MAG: peptidoglycan DD-metalloendopeptidase family protein [Candidatus Symbiothrix sp.]|jgi:murein DD-endopeptidase MepM/ murein hydrolase activator NlpD|nr:peptidoglycan DD-metalloendopeptidase family protein [Candidatus Symbiothrix sp.]
MLKELSRISVLSLLGITISFTSIEKAQAQVNPSREEIKRALSVSSTEPNLVADRTKPGMQTDVVDSLMMRLGLEMEDEMFPADDIYDSWNTDYLKAYAGVDVPDLYTIDLSGFVMPVEGKVTSPFGPRRKRFHYGTDIKLQTGDTVRAAFDGKVRVKQYERKGYGYYLVIRHSNGLETVYGHLSEYLVGQDEVVKAGQPIALGGSTGRSTGPHLHFEFRFLGLAINPPDIIDFDEFSTKDDLFVFKKSEAKTSNYSAKKYSTKGKSKIQYHRIKKGDTVAVIARKHGISVEKLRKLNNLKSGSVLKIGKSLRVS